MNSHSTYDLVIIGAGLAGSTLALQLKKAKDVSILLLEKRESDAPETTFKVGESTSEIGARYLIKDLDLDNYLNEKHLEKRGTRFFLAGQDSNALNDRVEISPELERLQPTKHIDRGVLENDLLAIAKDAGVDVQLGARVRDVNFGAEFHEVIVEGQADPVRCRWVVDASGRSALLKRKLNLAQEHDHHVNAAWIRVSSSIRVDELDSSPRWCSNPSHGRRHLSTNHLMGKGYWVWMIPLPNGCTSIGLVADPEAHPFERMNSRESFLHWLQDHEPQLSEAVSEEDCDILDFKVMKHFSHGTKSFFSADRWALTGDSGAFLDPLYSPGIDVIAISNKWICDLILRDLSGENIQKRALIYNHTQQQLVNGWLKLYQNMYQVFGNAQATVYKISWDWATYWSILNVLYVNDAYTDLDFLKFYTSKPKELGIRFNDLNARMQEFFRHMSAIKFDESPSDYVNLFAVEFLLKFQTSLHKCFERQELRKVIAQNLETLEQIATEMMARVKEYTHGVNEKAPLNRVDPYLFDHRGLSMEGRSIRVDPSVSRDIELISFAMRVKQTEPI